MRLAVEAGGQAPENSAYVQTLLGNLDFEQGRIAAARRAYRTALLRQPGYAPASAGLARTTAARGDLAGAIRRHRSVVALQPTPEHLTVLGEAELAAGRGEAGRRHLASALAQEREAVANGENADIELAMLEASHGNPDRAVALARRGLAAAPNVRAEDALGWALTRAGDPVAGYRHARRAIRLGSRDPLFLLHAGIAARDAGRTEDARRLLKRSLDLNPRFSPLWAPRARDALKRLG
jgi:tetratricopeptide (TPR) repeat protein